MKIIYKQCEVVCPSGLYRLGVQNCYFKKLLYWQDKKRITKKLHHHTGFEIHIITAGYQEYQVNSQKYKLEAGSYLLIGPNIPHKMIASSEYAEKYSFLFQLEIDQPTVCNCGKITNRILEDMDFIIQEIRQRKNFSYLLIENNILEIIISVLRLCQMEEKVRVEDFDDTEKNAAFLLAEQYINDNIEQSFGVSDIATYCGLSTKQLTRIFKQAEDMSPGEYIKRQRIKTIEILLADHTLSLKQISEKMNFSSEYYFNEFFKKNCGMPPGAYRKMLGK